jgi:hypothetical protein
LKVTLALEDTIVTPTFLAKGLMAYLFFTLMVLAARSAAANAAELSTVGAEVSTVGAGVSTVGIAVH